MTLPIRWLRAAPGTWTCRHSLCSADRVAAGEQGKPYRKPAPQKPAAEQGPEDRGWASTAPPACSLPWVVCSKQLNTRSVRGGLAPGLAQYVFFKRLGQDESLLRKKLRMLCPKVLIGCNIWGPQQRVTRAQRHHWRCILHVLLSF